MVMPVNPQATGVMGAAGGGPPVVVPSPFPHAGNQQDLNYVMNLLNQLSEQVRQNREQTEHIVEGVRQIHTRKQTPSTSGETPEVNGEAKQDQPQESQSDLHARIADLERRLDTTTTERDSALASAASWSLINEHYQSVLSHVNDKVRSYTSACQDAMFYWHRHYLDLLQKEKDANFSMRAEHSRWQEGLGKVLEYNREALKARAEELKPFERERAELRVQNRCYRRLLGLEVEESEDEVEEDEDEERMQL